jgi:hypothetical protein
MTPPLAFFRKCGFCRTLSSTILEVWIPKGLRADFAEVWIVKGLAGEGCGARSGCCVLTTHVSTVVHALQEGIWGIARGFGGGGAFE